MESGKNRPQNKHIVAERGFLGSPKPVMVESNCLAAKALRQPRESGQNYYLGEEALLLTISATGSNMMILGLGFVNIAFQI